MSASDHLSPTQFVKNSQLVKVHRGIPDIADEDRLGKHWSTNKKVAKHFAKEHDVHGQVAHDQDHYGQVYHGFVGKRHTLQNTHDEMDPEYQAITGKYGIYEKGSDERELTVQPGKPVLVTGRTTIKSRGPRGGVKSRTRTYNPPRVKKA